MEPRTIGRNRDDGKGQLAKWKRIWTPFPSKQNDRVLVLGKSPGQDVCEKCLSRPVNICPWDHGAGVVPDLLLTLIVSISYCRNNEE